MASTRPLKHAQHDAARAVLRVVGPLLILVGGAMFVTGIISFFERFDEGPRGLFGDLPGAVRAHDPDRSGDLAEPAPRPPNRFWMCFVGMPVAAVGFVLSRQGYLGVAARYVAGETAPVARDTIDYLARGTKESIEEVASAIRGGGGPGVRCPGCGRENDGDARFCDECGAALARVCPNCHERNDADAKFCDACGSGL